MKNFLIFSLLFFLYSCAEKISFKKLPSGPIKHQLISVARQDNIIHGIGLSGSTPADTKIIFEIENQDISTTSKKNGSFSFELKINNTKIKQGEFTFNINNKILQQVYNLQDLDQSLSQVFGPIIKVPGELEDTAFNNNKTKLFISETNGSKISAHKLKKTWQLGKPDKNLLIAPDNSQNISASMPRSITQVGDYLVATLAGTHELALIKQENLELVVKTKLNNPDGSLYLFDLATPLEIKQPIDPDNSGIKTTSIKKSTARDPEFILKLDPSHLLVLFTNYYQYNNTKTNQKSVIGPGILALLEIQNNKLKTLDIKKLDCKNPRNISKVASHDYIIACSGPWEFKSNKWLTTQAALINFNLTDSLQKITLKNKIKLDNFAPIKPIVINNKIIIPEYLGSKIIIRDYADTSNITNSQIKNIKTQDKISFTTASYFHDDIIFIATNMGNLISYSLSRGFFPFPFVKKIKFSQDKNNTIPPNPTKILFRDFAQNNQEGYTGWLISPSQTSIIPIDILKVMGP